MALTKLTVCLNGTRDNPYARYGVTQNPFPQIARHGYDAACLRLQSLGGEPIPDVQHIRDTLEGWDPAFIELCCRNYRPGVYVKFCIEFDL
jgi:hypothetical protein